MIGTQLGPYQITEELGAGGMATVYRGFQPNMERHVAVKVIHKSILAHDVSRERFQREARLIAKLEHPHLLPVYDFDGDHNPPYIVMRYLEGGTLKQVLEKGELPMGEMLYMLRQVATAIDYAHRQGIVHRDLKPSNIMIDREGNAFVTDFGIARAADTTDDLTGAGTLIGTPGYMSPEQAKGEPKVGAAADIYSLGAIVFEMLTGEVPYTGENHMAVLMAHVHNEVPSASERNPKLPPVVDETLDRALSKRPEDRFETAEALVHDLASRLRAETARAPQMLQTMTQTVSAEQLEMLRTRRDRRTETPSQSTPSDQQRQMTAVQFDVSELAEIQYEAGVETETVRNRMDHLWEQFRTVVEERGGVVQSRTNEVGVALWGRDRVSEDDAEQAIRAALAMRERVTAAAREFLGRDWAPSEESPLPFSAGITTGPVLLERSSESDSVTASGASLTLAGRLREAAPPGAILAAHEAYTQVRGVFTFHPHDPVRIRGRREPIEVYLVVQAKPRAFRLKARGIEGVETRMIGREVEHRTLQEALTLTLEDGETQVVTVVGEAGIGKSRLLYEFSNYTDLLDETVWFFQARATQPSMLQPYSLTRDLFSARFQILDSDPLDLVHEKFVRGVKGFLGEGREEAAELIGQLVGFDFSDRPRVEAALQDPEGFQKRALDLLGEFFTTASRKNPVVIHIEDIHWADDRSLDLINHLVRENTRLPMFVICMSRPSLYERRPQWGEGQRFHERIQLEPLSQLSSRRLVKEILKKLPEIPGALRDLVVDRADGNPFYIEELIKALIDDSVIVKGEDVWSVDTSRLSNVRVPATLTGVLQSRLDTLPPGHHQLLQRAAVVGRIFWDAAVRAVTPDGQDGEVDMILDDLREREMILKREESSFAGTTEYVFRHAILRDVTYETVVPRQRRAIHKGLAEWLLQLGGERAGEYTLRVAEHYALADESSLAAAQLREAARLNERMGAYAEALTTLKRAEDMLSGPENREQKLRIGLHIGSNLGQSGAFEKAKTKFEAVLREAVEHADKRTEASALGQLGRLAMWQDDVESAKTQLSAALPIMREVGDRKGIIFITRQMANLLVNEPEQAAAFAEESLKMAREIGDIESEGWALNSRAIVDYNQGNLDKALGMFEEGLATFQRAEDVRGIIMLAGNIAEIQMHRGHLDEAQDRLDLQLSLVRKADDKPQLAIALGHQGRLHLLRGEIEAARKALIESLGMELDMGVHSPMTLLLFAWLESVSGSRERALGWIGIARTSVVWQKNEVMDDIERVLPVVRGDLAPDAAEAHIRAGEGQELTETLKAVHREYMG